MTDSQFGIPLALCITLLLYSKYKIYFSNILSLCSPYTDSTFNHVTANLIQWWDTISHHLPSISFGICKNGFVFCQKGFCLFTTFSPSFLYWGKNTVSFNPLKLPVRNFHIVDKQPVCLKLIVPNASFPIFFSVSTVIPSAVHLHTRFSNVFVEVVWIKDGSCWSLSLIAVDSTSH